MRHKESAMKTGYKCVYQRGLNLLVMLFISLTGIFQLYIRCAGQQDVTLEATLFDEARLKSNSMNFSFTCE